MDDRYELIIYLLSQKLPEVDFEDMEECELDEWFYDEFEIREDAFDNLIKVLIPLCTISQSELTEKWYRGFGTENLWLMKQEVK